jgi:hypothetical protein
VGATAPEEGPSPRALQAVRAVDVDSASADDSAGRPRRLMCGKDRTMGSQLQGPSSGREGRSRAWRRALPKCGRQDEVLVASQPLTTCTTG